MTTEQSVTELRADLANLQRPCDRCGCPMTAEPATHERCKYCKADQSTAAGRLGRVVSHGRQDTMGKRRVPTSCERYGHALIDGRCRRCGRGANGGTA